MIALYAAAKAAGAEKFMELEDKITAGKGSRRDPEGHIWHFGKAISLGDVEPLTAG